MVAIFLNLFYTQFLRLTLKHLLCFLFILPLFRCISEKTDTSIQKTEDGLVNINRTDTCCSDIPSFRIDENEPNVLTSDETRSYLQPICDSGTALWNFSFDTSATKHLRATEEKFKELLKPNELDTFYLSKALYHIGEISEYRLMSYFKNIHQDSVLTKHADELFENTVSAYKKILLLKSSDWVSKARYQLGLVYENYAVLLSNNYKSIGITNEEKFTSAYAFAKKMESLIIDTSLLFHHKNQRTKTSADSFVHYSSDRIPKGIYTAALNYHCIMNKVDQNPPNDSCLHYSSSIYQMHKLKFLKRIIDISDYYFRLKDKYATSDYPLNNILSLSIQATFSTGLIYTQLAEESVMTFSSRSSWSAEISDSILLRSESFSDSAVKYYRDVVLKSNVLNTSDNFSLKSKATIARLLYLIAICSEKPADTQNPQHHPSSKSLHYYKKIFNLAEADLASGKYVRHAFVKLYNYAPEKYGTAELQMVQTAITSGKQWKCSRGLFHDWFSVHHSDSAWISPFQFTSNIKQIKGFPNTTPVPMWDQEIPKENGKNLSQGSVYFRRPFYLSELPLNIEFYISCMGKYTIYLNDSLVIAMSGPPPEPYARNFSLMKYARTGKNILAINASDSVVPGWGLYAMIIITTQKLMYLPKSSELRIDLSLEDVGPQTYQFPTLKEVITDID